MLANTERPPAASGVRSGCTGDAAGQVQGSVLWIWPFDLIPENSQGFFPDFKCRRIVATCYLIVLNSYTVTDVFIVCKW